MRVWIILATVALVGCDRELSRSSAASLIRSHLESLAPSVLRASDSVRLDINVEEILRPGEGTREARFRVLLSVPDTAIGYRSDSTQQLTAEFHRSDRGWALRRYGPEFKELVATIVTIQWSRDLAYLAEPIEKLEAAHDSLDTPRRHEAIRALGRYDLQTYRRLSAGVPSSQLTQYVAAHKLQPPDSLEWGYVPPDDSDGQGVIWAKRRGTAAPICATAVGLSGPPPREFYWVETTFGTTCDTPQKRFTTLYAQDSILAIINRQDGILRPEQARLK